LSEIDPDTGAGRFFSASRVRMTFSVPAVRVADVALPVDVVLRGPVAVAPRCPGPEVVVERDGVVDPERLHGLLDVPGNVLEGELGRVHSDDDKARVPIRVVPALHVGQRANAVDAGVRPEVDEDNLAAERRER
jgi:hypothetical protein